jgi:hypothetical protein
LKPGRKKVETGNIKRVLRARSLFLFTDLFREKEETRQKNENTLGLHNYLVFLGPLQLFGACSLAVERTPLGGDIIFLLLIGRNRQKSPIRFYGRKTSILKHRIAKSDGILVEAT